MRLGIDHDLLTYLEAGRIAQDQGAAAVSLHARTAAQLYSGRADWTAIARLKAGARRARAGQRRRVERAQDALALMRGTGADGVVIGRGLSGPALAVPRPGRRLRRARARPGAAAGRGGRAAGRPRPAAGRPAAASGPGCATCASTPGWYLTGYPVGGEVRRRPGHHRHAGRSSRPSSPASTRPSSARWPSRRRRGAPSPVRRR